MVTVKDAKEAVNVIIDKISPLSVILFGSVARDGKGEDIDLLVITDDKSAESDNYNLFLHKHLKRFHRRCSIDTFVVPLLSLRRFYMKGRPFLRLIAREGRPLYMRDAAREWFKHSEEELAMAEYLFKGGYFKGACYHAQQSVEKAIKANLLAKGWELEKTHSIERLIAIGADYRLNLDLSDRDMVFIDSIYGGGYPLGEGLLPLGDPG